MNTPQIPTPEAGDTLTPGDELPPGTLAFVSPALAVTATVTESPVGGAVPDQPAEEPPSTIPAWLRRRIERDLPPTAKAYVSPPKADFVPHILREAVTPSQPSVAAPVTAAVTIAPVAGSICPTCQRRVPARLSGAERQRAYRARKREQGQG
jgi:hypothetical protein